MSPATEDVNGIRRNVTKKLRELFLKRFLQAFYGTLGKFIYTTVESRRHFLN